MELVVCPECGSEIASDDVNVAKDVAYCRACNSITHLSELLAGDAVARSAGEDAGGAPAAPPRQCRVRDDGVTVRIIAGARSVGAGCGALFAAGFWNGIVSVFVLFTMSGTIYHIFGDVPEWFPAPEMEGETMSLGMVIFLWIFLMPFIMVGLGLAGACVTALMGRCEVRMRGSEGVIFTGFGPIGWKRRFDAGAVESVRVGRTSWSQNNRRQPCIVIKARKEHRLASILPDDRRQWMVGELRRWLL